MLKTKLPVLFSNPLFPLIHILQEAVFIAASRGLSVPDIDISILEVELQVTKYVLEALKVRLTPSSNHILNPWLLPNVYPVVSVYVPLKT